MGQTTSAASIVGTVNVTIDNNTIDRIPDSYAILTDVADGIGNSTINITNNQIGQLAGSLGQIGDDFDGAVLMRVRGTPAASVNMTVSGNNIRGTTNGGGRMMYIDGRHSRTANFDILNNTIRNAILVSRPTSKDKFSNGGGGVHEDCRLGRIASWQRISSLSRLAVFSRRTGGCSERPRTSLEPSGTSENLYFEL